MYMVRRLARLALALFITLGVVGCGGDKPAQTGTTALDPVDQEILDNAKKRGNPPPNLPPGAMVNSGGEVVLPEKSEDDQ